MSAKVLKKIFSSISVIAFSLMRMIIIGGLTVAFLILYIDKVTDSAFGVNNLIIILSSFTFFTVFIVLTIEIFLYLVRKEKRKHSSKEKLSESKF